jgi:hypothetical protein
MPIKAEMRWFYPIDWPQLSNHIRFERAGASVSAAGAHMAKPFAFCRMDGGTTRSVRPGAIIAAAVTVDGRGGYAATVVRDVDEAPLLMGGEQHPRLGALAPVPLRAILCARESATIALANRSAEWASTLEERSGMPMLLRADGAIGRGGRNYAEAL